VVGFTIFSDRSTFSPYVTNHKSDPTSTNYRITNHFFAVCHSGTIALLPSLPVEWHSGRVTGLRARGGFELDLEWNGGSLERAVVRSLNGNTARISYGELETTVRLSPGEEISLDGSLQVARRRKGN
jgi:hypothetical protein